MKYDILMIDPPWKKSKGGLRSCSPNLRRMDRLTKDKILSWIQRNEFVEYKGGNLIYADDLEAFINKLYSQSD